MMFVKGLALLLALICCAKTQEPDCKTIEKQARQFMDDFRNDPRPIEFTKEQIHWFKSLGGNSDGRRKRQAPLSRKEYRTLSLTERNNLHEAFNAMKIKLIDGMSQYDIFVNMHTSSMAPAAHHGVSFLSWHRVYLVRLENALQTHDPTVMLPYWDNELDQHLPSPSDSAIWTPAYLGNNNGAVTTGFAAEWGTPTDCTPSVLTRNTITGAAGKSYLFTNLDVDQILYASNYKDFSCNYNCAFEFKHAAVHWYVGGNFAYSPCTAIDPVFWLHHAYTDCLWEEYREICIVDIETDYPDASEPVSMMGGPAQKASAPMLPFSGMVNIQGLSRSYISSEYYCVPRPSTCTFAGDCASDILYCDTTVNNCRAKVRKGGDCTGLNPTLDVCDSTECLTPLVGMCQSNTCVCLELQLESIPS